MAVERTKNLDDRALELLRRVAPLQCEPEALELFESEIVTAYAEIMKELGIETEILEGAEGRPSLIGRVPGTGNGQSVIFNTHLLVPVSPPEEWSYPPYELTNDDGRLYAMGVSDTKAGIVAMMLAASTVASEGLAGDVYIGLGAGGERAGFIGTAELVRHLRPDYAVVCEPTSLDIVHVQYGCVWATFTVGGKQGFVDAGVSALANAMPLYEGLLQLNRDVNVRRHPLLPPSKLAVNAFQAGHHWLLTPDRAVIKVDRRFIPGESVESVRAEFQELLDRLKRENDAFDANLRFELEVPPVEMPKDSAVARAASEAIEQVRGVAPAFLGIKGFTEAVHAHLAGVPTIICGPGSTAVIHAADEWIPEVDLYDAVSIYAGIARSIASMPAESAAPR